MTRKKYDHHQKNIETLLNQPLTVGVSAIKYIEDRFSDGDRVFIELIAHPDTLTYELYVTLEDSSDTHPDKHCSALHYMFSGTMDKAGIDLAENVRNTIVRVLEGKSIEVQNPDLKETDSAITIIQKEGVIVLPVFSNITTPKEVLLN